MIRVENIKKYFPIKDGFFNNKSGDVKAVENVSFEIPEGEILGLVGRIWIRQEHTRKSNH